MNKRLFIADDDANLLELYKAIFCESPSLDFFGSETETCCDLHLFDSGESLLVQFERAVNEGTGIPLCILDMRMPGLSGFDTAKKIRLLDPQTIIIIITAYADISSTKIRQDLQQDIYYFKKPFNEEEIFSVVDSLFKQWNRNEENRKLYEQIQEFNTQLDQRVQEEIEKNRQKDLMIERQHRFEYMGEMMRNVAHHWRQPLNELGLIVQDLHDAYAFGETDKAYVSKSTNNAMRCILEMSETIDGFRDLFQPSEKISVFTMLSVFDKINHVVKVRFEHEHIQLDFRTEQSPSVKGYFNEFCGIVLNLLLNAQKAFVRNRTAKPHIQAEAAKTEDGQTLISIKDNAGGLSQIELDGAFDPYSGVDSLRARKGLGLFVAKNMIENHMDGTIRIVNEKYGAAVYITLPKVTVSAIS